MRENAMRQTLRDLSSRVPDLARRLPDLRDLPFQQRRGASATSAAGIGLAAVGLGAALMYLFDPHAGQRRRALMRERLTSFLRRGSAVVDGASRDVANRARGLVIEMRSRFAGASPDLEAAESRARGERHTQQ